MFHNSAHIIKFIEKVTNCRIEVRLTLQHKTLSKYGKRIKSKNFFSVNLFHKKSGLFHKSYGGKCISPE